MPPQQPQKGNGGKAAIIILLLLLVAGVGLVLANEFGLFETHEHEWQAATCGAPQTCATCGAVEGEPLSHNWQAATCVSPAYCTSCGAVDDATCCSNRCRGVFPVGLIVDRLA